MAPNHLNSDMWKHLGFDTIDGRILENYQGSGDNINSTAGCAACAAFQLI